MKKILTILFLALQMGVFANTLVSDSATTIVQSLENEEIGKGKVKIYQDSRIENLLGRRKEVSDATQNFTIGKGFRVQIFSGNNQKTAKKEAFDRDAIIKRDMPDLETYITFKSPFWRLRAGNFRTYEEAYLILRKIKELFPQYGKETYIIKEDIKLYH
ncbi:MAG: SPOR domain-containing protein [Bacteroidales bacterium]|nr:SPOR domain-containing protein [Bacteroidales bacterium]